MKFFTVTGALCLVILLFSCGNTQQKAGHVKEVILRQKFVSSSQIARVINKLEIKDTSGIGSIMDSLAQSIKTGQDSISALPSLKGKADAFKNAALGLFGFYGKVHDDILPLHIEVMSMNDENITAEQEEQINASSRLIDSLTQYHGGNFRDAITTFDSIFPPK